MGRLCESAVKSDWPASRISFCKTVFLSGSTKFYIHKHNKIDHLIAALFTA